MRTTLRAKHRHRWCGRKAKDGTLWQVCVCGARERASAADAKAIAQAEWAIAAEIKRLDKQETAQRNAQLAQNVSNITDGSADSGKLEPHT